MVLEPIFDGLVNSGISLFGNIFMQSFSIILIFIILALGFLPILNRIVKKVIEKTKSDTDDRLYSKINKPSFMLSLLFGVWLSLIHINMVPWITHTIASGLVVVFMIMLLQVVNILIDEWGYEFTKKTKSGVDEMMLPLIHTAVNIIFIIVSILWIFQVWELNVTPYLAGLGIGGMVLGLAFQDTLKNIFGGISLILDGSFEVGDKVKLESGEIGVIHALSLRSTKIKTYSNEIISVPNGSLATAEIRNYSSPGDSVRVKVNFNVAYGSDIDKVKKNILKVVSRLDGIMSKPKPSIDFVQMGDFALQFTAKFWVARWDKAYGKELEATEKIYKALQKAKIDIPYPTYTVKMKK